LSDHELQIVVSLIFREEWFDANQKVLVFNKIDRLLTTKIESYVKTFSYWAYVRASKSRFFVRNIKIGTRIVPILSVAFWFDFLRVNVGSFKSLISLDNWFLTVLQFKLKQVFKVVNSDDRVKDAWNFRKKVLFRIIWRQCVTNKWRESYISVKL